MGVCVFACLFDRLRARSHPSLFFSFCQPPNESTTTATRFLSLGTECHAVLPKYKVWSVVTAGAESLENDGYRSISLEVPSFTSLLPLFLPQACRARTLESRMLCVGVAFMSACCPCLRSHTPRHSTAPRRHALVFPSEPCATLGYLSMWYGV